MICVNSVSVSPKQIFLRVGEWYYGTSVEVYPVYVEYKEVKWHSDNTNVATVNSSTGYIYAKTTGKTKIYATSTDGREVSDYLTVTVVESAM